MSCKPWKLILISLELDQWEYFLVLTIYLPSLPLSYHITHDPLPSINCVFSLVLQQERQLMRSVVFDSKILINSTNPNNWKKDKVIETGWKSQGRGRSRNQNYGSYCHKLNHTADECFLKHGFPPWYKRKNDRAINNIFSQNYAATNKTEDIDQEGLTIPLVKRVHSLHKNRSNKSWRFSKNKKMSLFIRWTTSLVSYLLENWER